MILSFASRLVSFSLAALSGRPFGLAPSIEEIGDIPAPPAGVIGVVKSRTGGSTLEGIPDIEDNRVIPEGIEGGGPIVSGLIRGPMPVDLYIVLSKE
jgi:hypothetical protein